MNSSPLNPDAPVFVPGTAPGADILLAESPRKPQPMDDIELPDVAQFETEVVRRPAELLDLDNCDQLNGHHNVSFDGVAEKLNGNEKNTMDSLGFGFSVGVESDKAKDISLIQDFDRIQKDTTDFCNIQVFQAHSETNPFASDDNEELLERLKSKERDPMSMSFYQEKDDDTCERLESAVDLNAVQPLPDSDSDDDHDDKENRSPQPDNDLMRPADHDAPNNDLFAQGANFIDYVNNTNQQNFPNIQLETDQLQQDVMQTDTPESHKLLFEQIPEIPDGKSSELGFNEDNQDPSDRAITPQEETSQDVEMECKPEADSRPESAHEPPHIQNDTEYAPFEEVQQAEHTENHLISETSHTENHVHSNEVALSPAPADRGDVTPEPAHEQENIKAEIHNYDRVDEHFDNVEVHEIEPRDAETPHDLHEEVDLLSADGPQESEIASPLPSETPLSPAPHAEELHADLLATSPAPHTEDLLAASPAPHAAELLAASPAPHAEELGADLMAASPAPAQSPLPAASLIPAEPEHFSPIPAESPAPETAPSPLPAEVPLPAEPAFPAESPLPAASPLPDESALPVETSIPSESPLPAEIERPMQSPAPEPAESPLPVEPELRPETASPLAAAPVGDRLTPDVPHEEPIERTRTPETASGPAPDIVPEPSHRDLVTDIDIGIPESHAQEICVPVTSEIVEEAVQLTAGTPPPTPAVDLSAPAFDEKPAAADHTTTVAAAAAVGVAAATAAAAAAKAKTPAKKIAASPASKATATPKSATKPAATSATKLAAASATKKPAAAPAARPAARPSLTKSPATTAAKPKPATTPTAAKPAPRPAVKSSPAPVKESATAKAAAPARAAPAARAPLKAPSTRPAAPAARPAAPRPATAPATRAAPKPAPTARPAPRPTPRPTPAPAKPKEVKPAEKKPLTNGDAKPAPIRRVPLAAKPAPRPAPRPATAPATAPATKLAAPRPPARAPLDKQSKDLANKRITAKAAPPRTAATKTGPLSKNNAIKSVTKKPLSQPTNGLVNGDGALKLKSPPSPPPHAPAPAPAHADTALPDVIA